MARRSELDGCERLTFSRTAWLRLQQLVYLSGGRRRDSRLAPAT